MPNHVINELIFRGVDTAAQQRVLAATCNAEGNVDFEVLVPLPLNIWWGSVGARHEKAFRNTALAWSRENWGTKWNAYSHQPTERTVDTLTLRFETAWAPPYPWLAAVFNKTGLPFEHNWLDEGCTESRSGAFTVDGVRGTDWDEQVADEPMHRHLHYLHYGVEAFEEDAA